MFSPQLFSKFKFVLVVLAICCTYNDIGVGAGPAATRLLQQLFVDNPYNIDSIPIEDDAGKHEVSVEFEMTHLVELDTKNEVFRANLWVTLRWQDYQLIWNPANYSGVNSILLPENKVWTPTMLLKNSITGADDKILFSKVKIHSDGEVEWWRIGQFSSTCDIDVTLYPFDEQECSMEFISWYEDDAVFLYNIHFADREEEDTLTASNLSKEKPEARVDGEWRIVDQDTKVDNKTSKTKAYRTAVFTVRMQRLPLFYVTNLILPCTLITFLAVVAFLLPPDGGDKIGLSITVLLALTVYMLIIADQLPPTPREIPLIGVYFMVLLVLSTLSVIAAVSVISLDSRTPDRHKMPNWVRIVFCRWLAWILRVKTPGSKVTLRDLMNKDSSKDFENGNDAELVCLKDRDKETFEASPGNPVMSAILSELRFITTKMKEDAEQEDSAEDWKIVALVVDRFCLWAFGVFFIIATIAVFARVPNSG